MKVVVRRVKKASFSREFRINDEVDTPSKGKVVTRLKSDLIKLSVLLAGERLYRVPVRVKKEWLGRIWYG